MRPNSRGIGTSAGAPPGTGIRPGSGRKPPGSARLRTGVAPSGAGTQAAQGIALSASINVHDRPVTGQGVKGMKAGGGPGRLVEDASYYIGLLRKRIADITSETRKLNGIIDTSSKDSSQFNQLEKKYESLLKSKESLEGQLADYNLAMDKVRTSTDTEDVKEMAYHLSEKNRQTGQELDRTLLTRKQREGEIQRVEDQIESVHREIQARINDLEPGKLRSYNELMGRQRELQEVTAHAEHRLNEISARIAHYEEDDKSNAIRKEFSMLERSFQSLRRDCDAMHEELDIASMEPREAHTRFVARVNDFKSATKNVDDRVESIREELGRMRQNLDDLDTSPIEDDNGEMAKYELLVKRDQDMTAFMDKFDETRGGIIQEQQAAQELIIALLEHLSKGIEDSSQLPTQEAMGEMEEAKHFKEKNLATAKRTMESLFAEKKKRERELEILRTSEPRLTAELNDLRQLMTRMHSEMKEFQDIDKLRREYDATQRKLQDMKQSYIRRRDSMRQQVQALNMESEALKRSLAANEVAKEIEETERRLKLNERTIFDLREFVDTRTRETDFEVVKGTCLKLMDTLNNSAINKCQGSMPNTRQGPGAQAKW